MSHTAIVKIATRCNLECVFCLEGAARRTTSVDPSTAQIAADLDALYARGARHITFMGAETFFRKDLGDLLAHARRIGFTRVGVTTNGTVLSKPGFLAASIASGLDFVEISIHGHTESLVNTIAGVGFAYERQAAALDEIRSAALPAIVNVVVCATNKDHIAEIAAYVKERIGPSLLRIKMKFVSVVGAAREATNVTIPYSAFDAVAVGDAIEASGAPYWFHNFPLCALGRHAAQSHELATLGRDDRYFEVDQVKSRNYFDSGHQLSGRRRPDESCAQCTLRPLCPGLESAYVERYGSADLSPRTDDPCALLRRVFAQHGVDPDLAPSRLEALRAPGKPDSAGPLAGSLRFTHPSAPHSLDVVVAPHAGNDRAFASTKRFSLSYRPWAAGDAYRHPAVATLLEDMIRELERGDAAGMDIDAMRAAMSRVAVDGGWTAE